MFVMWSFLTNLMCTVQMALEVQIVHATRTVLLTKLQIQVIMHGMNFLRSVPTQISFIPENISIFVINFYDST